MGGRGGWTGRTGWTDGRADGQTGAHADEGSEWTNGRTGRRVHRRTRAPGGEADERTSWRTGGLANKRTGWTVKDRFPKCKTPKLTHQLTWLSEIQRGCPRVTVQLRHLPPLS